MYDNPRYNMAKVSIWLGAASILMCQIPVIPLVLSGISITLALLSRGSDGSFPPSAKAGLVAGFISLAISGVILFANWYMLVTQTDFLSLYPQYVNGKISFNELLEQLQKSLQSSIQ
ncbi:hypothetical protein [Butyrivibrio sp. NC3005]|uniref:hypothetical protein n=1 Tax=Butyrivibrio sp. NC3005 TaxID=1280685 RepID=UPI00042076C3|nr:hypothetical protein [Butyrivibrio sp. NC3005]